MVVNDGSGWTSIGREDRTERGPVHAGRETGATPDSEECFLLHDAAEYGSPEAVAELAQRVGDIDALDDDDEEYPGCTVLWTAVFAHRPDDARVLAAAGADPWRPMMNGWSPGRLSLASPTPDLFTIPPGETGLSPAEAAAVTEARRSTAALGDLYYFGLGMVCVAGITAGEAARRLEAVPADDADAEAIMEDPRSDYDDSLTVVGVTDVPGGCVVSQPWGYTPSTSGIAELLSAGTVCYGMYNNPKGAITDDSPATASSRKGIPTPAGAACTRTTPPRRSSPLTSTATMPWPTAAPARVCGRPTRERSPVHLTCG
ncbi:ankyrin repeat domain-containing protein [Nonomuraea sp. NPDC049158]|uniref:ankyrin repeat domain-containing protein n=1 Tax=Nonomuraea sp. NPDC049158 TaxID=3155649 RepID=UPI0033F4F080